MQKSVHQLVIKVRRNGKNLGLHIMNAYPIFETLRKTHGYANSKIMNLFYCGHL